jgi:uncharacterized protein
MTEQLASPYVNPLHPIQQVIMKVRSDCNLACPNCYVYEGADQTWQDKPLVMSEAVLAQAAVRMGEHAAKHSSRQMSAIFHGGEPLMNGSAYLSRAASILRSAMPSDTSLKLGMQTNGVLLNERMLDTLLAADIAVGVSLDGPAVINDKQRPNKAGRGTFDMVSRNLRLLGSEKYRSIFAGIICTIDSDSEPVEVFDTLAAFRPPLLDFSLPHATWDTPPVRSAENPTPMGLWLNKALDHWTQQEGERADIKVRLFQSAFAAILGGGSTTEQVGTSPSAMAVIETDGTYEQTDSMKVAYDGAAATGLDVWEHSLDDVLIQPSILQKQLGIHALSKTCQDCYLVTACGGGSMSHRYSGNKGHGDPFDNPTVYCDDMKVFLPHVRDVIQQFVAENS